MLAKVKNTRYNVVCTQQAYISLHNSTISHLEADHFSALCLKNNLSLSGKKPSSAHQLSQRPVEAASSFNFFIVTTLVSISIGFFAKIVRWKKCSKHPRKDTFYNGLNENDQDSLNAVTGGNLLIKTTRETLHIIENKTKVRYSRNKPNVSRMNMTSRENASKTDGRIYKLADQISTLVDIFAKKVVTPATVKAVEESCVTCGGNHAYYNCDATNSNQSSVCAATGTLMSNTIPNPKGKMRAITTRSGVAYEGPSIPTNPTPKKVVEQETEETTDKEQTNFQRSTAHIQRLVVPISEPDVPKTLPKTNIPYPSRLNDQKLREKATNQMKKFL
nr:hypothetical protein [Tanacetum cinerariifolium]